MESWVENILIVLFVVTVFTIIIGGALFAMHSSEIDYNEACMRATAVKYCEDNNMYFHYYTAGSLDSEYFKCVENDRDASVERFEYSGEELDYCMNKDAASIHFYKSKYELNSDAVSEDSAQ